MDIYIYEIKDHFLHTDTQLRRLLSKTKAKKISKLKLLKDREINFLSDVIIKLITSEKFDISPEKVTFKKTINGKPYIENIKNCYFNISHSGDLIVFVVDCQKIGIDVEKMIPLYVKPIDFFSHKQLHIFNNLNERDKLIYFYQLWTLKESFIKMRGLNSGIKFNHINLNYKKFSTFLYRNYIISVCIS